MVTSIELISDQTKQRPSKHQKLPSVKTACWSRHCNLFTCKILKYVVISHRSNPLNRKIRRPSVRLLSPTTDVLAVFQIETAVDFLLDYM